jgi:hypothetical protein
MIIVDAVARMNCESALDADERWIFVDRDAAVVEEDVVVGTQAESVVQCIGSVMGCYERSYVGGLAQEGAFGLHSSELLEEGESHALRIGEIFEGLVAPPLGVDSVVDIVHPAEEHGHGLFWEGQLGVSSGRAT